jgi:hypothetical protein
MPSVSWPTVVLGVAALGAVTALGLTHVLEPAWIESAASAVLGALFGHTIGFSRGMARGRVLGAAPVSPKA